MWGRCVTFAKEIGRPMAQGDQVKNGKAFEYAIAKVYQEYISQQGRQAVLVENEACLQAKRLCHSYYFHFVE